MPIRLLRLRANGHDVVVIVLAEVAFDVQVFPVFIELTEEGGGILNTLVNPHQFPVNLQLVRYSVRLRVCY